MQEGRRKPKGESELLDMGKARPACLPANLSLFRFGRWAKMRDWVEDILIYYYATSR